MRCWAQSWGAISFIWWPFHDDLLNIEHSNSFYRFLPDTFIGFPYIWNTTLVDMIYFLRKSIQFAISTFVWCPCTSISPSLQWTQGIGSKRTDNLFCFFFLLCNTRMAFNIKEGTVLQSSCLSDSEDEWENFNWCIEGWWSLKVWLAGKKQWTLMGTIHRNNVGGPKFTILRNFIHIWSTRNHL